MATNDKLTDILGRPLNVPLPDSMTKNPFSGQTLPEYGGPTFPANNVPVPTDPAPLTFNFNQPSTATDTGTSSGGTSSGGSSGGGGGSSSGSSGDIDRDKDGIPDAEDPDVDIPPTRQEKQAAENLGSVSQWNATSTFNQMKQGLANYDLGNEQNRALADVENNQNARKAASERAQANQKFQQALRALIGTSAPALFGSQAGNLANLAAVRTDLDNQTVLDSLTQNRNTVENAYQEALNQNVLAANDLASNAEYALRGLQSDQAAQLNNIHADLFKKPEEVSLGEGMDNIYESNKRPANIAQLAGYTMPDDAGNAARKLRAAQQASYGDTYANSLLRRA